MTAIQWLYENINEWTKNIVNRVWQGGAYTFSSTAKRRAGMVKLGTESRVQREKENGLLTFTNLEEALGLAVLFV